MPRSGTAMASAPRVKPVTPSTWPAFETLFSAPGAPGFCWCATYRFAEAPTMGREERRDAMRALVDRRTPIGMVALVDGEPAGWCSVAPRATYAPLARSRAMPVVDEEAWTIPCLFVRREHRGEGVARALVDGAVAYARKRGARIIEAYPWDTAGLSGTGPAAHWGTSALYRAAGFHREGNTRRWVRRL